MVETSLKTQSTPGGEFARAPRLILEFIDGLQEDIGTIVQVTPYGLHKVIPKLAKEQTSMLSLKAFEGTQNLSIRYNVPTSSYYIQEDSAVSQTFVRVEGTHSLLDRQTVALCDSRVTIQISQSKYSLHSLFITCIKGPQEGFEFEFAHVQSPIHIGRLSTCHVAIDDESMSRIQCTIAYEFPNGGWSLRDGDGRKRSLNGTWVLIQEYTEVYHTMVVKTASAMLLVTSTQAKIEPVSF